MPSEFQKILMAMQSDLNAITISAVASNLALSRMLSMYEDNMQEFSPAKHKQCADDWSKTLNALTSAIEAFGADGLRLQEYIDGKK